MIFDIMNIMDKTVNIQDNIAVAWHPDLSEAKEMELEALQHVLENKLKS